MNSTPWTQPVVTTFYNQEVEILALKCRLDYVEKTLTRLETDKPLAEPKLKDLNIGEAIELMKKGWHVTRQCWHNDRVFIWYYKGADKDEADEIRVKTIRGKHCPWTPNHDELLANDWKAIVGTLTVSNGVCF